MLQTKNDMLQTENDMLQTDESSPKISNAQTFNDSSNNDAQRQLDGSALPLQTAEKEYTESSNMTDVHQNTEESSRNGNQLNKNPGNLLLYTLSE